MCLRRIGCPQSCHSFGRRGLGGAVPVTSNQKFCAAMLRMTRISRALSYVEPLRGLASRSKAPAPGSADDWEKFRRDGKAAVDFIADYYKNISNYPVKSQVKPGYLKVCTPVPQGVFGQLRIVPVMGCRDGHLLTAVHLPHLNACAPH